MSPQYSILYFNQALREHYSEISKQLSSGIKVFWFGSDEETAKLKADFPQYHAAFFLQVFSTSNLQKSSIPSRKSSSTESVSFRINAKQNLSTSSNRQFLLLTQPSIRWSTVKQTQILW